MFSLGYVQEIKSQTLLLKKKRGKYNLSWEIQPKGHWG